LSNIERSIFDSSPLPTATLAGTDHILYYVNPAFCRLAGKTKDELTGKPFAAVLTQDRCLASLNRVYGTGEAGVHAEPEDPDAHSTSWAYTMWPIRGAGDRPVGVMMQVTETTRFHQRAIAMNEQLLLSGVRRFIAPRQSGKGLLFINALRRTGPSWPSEVKLSRSSRTCCSMPSDATPASGQVVAHLYPAPSWLREIHARYGYCLSIADTGTGVAPQDRARIFQPFFTTKGERGTGLGLWVSMGIINRIGGSMRVWSARLPGRSGTCFSAFLPVEEAIFAPLRRRRGGES